MKNFGFSSSLSSEVKGTRVTVVTSLEIGRNTKIRKYVDLGDI